jgi:hypothetical protein
MQYWPALKIVNQMFGELGLRPVQTLFAENEPQPTQAVAALNSAGNELLTYYAWQQFAREWEFDLVAGQGEYPLPPGWKYFIDQTQWDRTNHWPILGPKNPAEWAWLKGGLVASFPRMRYRVKDNNFCVFPTPEADSQFHFAMEYVTGNWLQSTGVDDPDKDMVTADGDTVWYDPWLMVKFTKLKWVELKGFDTAAPAKDFQRVYNALIGKDTGAQILSLAPRTTPIFIGPYSIPDGSWVV